MNNSPIYWKMKNGKSISVDDMDLNHLRNVLKMIIRNRNKAIEQLKAKSKFQFKLNGDMANEFNQSYLSDDNDDELEEIYEELILNKSLNAPQLTSQG